MPDLPRRISSAILSSLSAGVVPRVGLEYIAVGRKREVEASLQDLDNIAGGAAAFRIVAGRYGSGKSFFLQAIRNYALEQGFITADADLSPEKRLTGPAGLETYRELLQRLASRARPEGGALEGLLQKWINSIRLSFIQDGYGANDPDLPKLVEKRIYETVNEMEDLAHGFDFARVLSAYYLAYTNSVDEKKEAALRWLRGEYATKTEAKALLGTGEIITGENWYDYIKLLAAFSFRSGSKGLLLFIDECTQLAKIGNRQSRENNYEKLLALFNDVMQGKAERLGIYLAGTPQFIEDDRRGLFSYQALKSRLAESRFAREGYTDYSGPVLRLSQLSQEEIYVLLERLRDIHAFHHAYESELGNRELSIFLEQAFSKAGAEEFITPREIARDFLGLLNITRNENLNFDDLVYRDGYRVEGYKPGGSFYADFEV